MCEIQDFSKLELLPAYRETLRIELDIWHKYYLPIGKTVLDVGAGCGETALFYLNHGAQKVICIECPGEALEVLRKNFGNDPRVLIVPAFIDSVKIDIEGKEEGLVLETHFNPVFSNVWERPRAILWKLKRSRLPTFNYALHKSRITLAHVIRTILDRLKL